jgi:glycosyltransferase involved in cell wall biosynthesis
VKILVLVFHFPPISGGGVVVITDIINKFTELGNDVTVITPDLKWDGEQFSPKINSKIKIIRTVTPSRTKIKIAARRCQSNMRKKAIEVGKINNFDFIFTIFHPFHLVPKAAVEAGKQLDIPSIIKVDDAIYQKVSGIKSIQRKIEKMINGKTLRSGTKILVSNNDTKKVIIDEYDVKTKNISIIPNGVDLSLFKTNIKKNPEKIVFTGAMYYHRGLDILLEAIPSVIKKIPNAKFVLLGSGGEMNKLKKIVSDKKLEKSVEFTGWINRDEIPQKISDASIGIGPLRLTDVTSRALPIKVLEYMASSIPIIAKRGTLPLDVLENEKNGYFVDTADDLAQKIITLLNEPKKVECMGIQSLDMVQKFSWDNVVINIIENAKKSKNTFVKF